ncbi:hypothetical protein LZQ00_08255 [Sphingobacterium sp. SRCM116780]|uniref:hypothetical protein n=1 Tax=Sphingobacterium sp. SRCM116780 TaxID=2907623 RepID=UPI001F45885A|nr:hypothetical protein [Sphingobacterium sp. SRCM116780]UIR57799.1 hypothetical protein LZQ00_08255 [Sphingobacterium sp. SRCM116780]
MKNSTKTQESLPDNIALIAELIWQDWKNVYFGAKPYLMAMQSINSIHDPYFEDSAKMIVNYFLANASTWRGETARRVKTQLKLLLAQEDSKD